MDNQGGMAVSNVDSNLADFATISATGKEKYNWVWCFRTRAK
jgi:hypothetical protein